MNRMVCSVKASFGCVCIRLKRKQWGSNPYEIESVSEVFHLKVFNLIECEQLKSQNSDATSRKHSLHCAWEALGCRCHRCWKWKTYTFLSHTYVW